MAFSINRATLLGNITKDPTQRYTQSGQSVVTFSIATNRSIKQQDGTYKDLATFHNVVIWGKLGEFISNNCKKGTRICIEGRIENRSYTDNNGVTKYISEVVADTAIPMSERNNNANQSNENQTQKSDKEFDFDINPEDFDDFLQSGNGKSPEGDQPDDPKGSGIPF